ncbi:PAS domain S-box protein [Solirubrobacter ginsenosidimutans]|uniref:histidine kinase n=1 Tax=Solirubrobacter ginsenosidimutans TaxID=490573 RepID=A0A9X3N240_9ACTN|nr:PAS domain S-box protein [Solirubrobacter ginsenosidimutans]MDA0166857.1 PAS domain S-box protein [Solirubrobacter ginsenosidimutans]
MRPPVRDGEHLPLLARLRVGTKLMLLALLPVGVLAAASVTAAVGAWRAADDLRDFQAETRASFAAGDLARALSDERAAIMLARLGPNSAADAAVGSAQRQTDIELRRAAERAASASVHVDAAGRVAAIRRQLQAPRLQAAAGRTGEATIADSYGSIVRDVLDLVRDLDSGRRRPTASVRYPADAYVAIQGAIEPAERERLDVAALLTPRGRDRPAGAAARWATLEAAKLDDFRANASTRLATDLAASLFAPAAVRVSDVRADLLASPDRVGRRTTPPAWLAASSARISDLRRIAGEARGELQSAVTRDLDAAVARRNRVFVVSLAVLGLVTALALVLRRSITRPLAEVSASARALSGGDLSVDVEYVGRDEIGDVAEAFRDLQITTERLADEIRGMNAAITRNQLDHRADVTAFEGTWLHLLGGMNETVAAFAELQGRRREAELELERVFTTSVDLLCIMGFDGYLKRVNPSWARTFGFTEEELRSRPVIEFVHPEDRARTAEAAAALAEGQELVEFENRHVCRDGTVRWLQWTSRPVVEQGLMYGVARDVTDRRRSESEQAALRRVATLVARGAAPIALFDAVAREVGLLCDADFARLERFEPDGTVMAIAAWSRSPESQLAVGERFALEGTSIAALVTNTGRPARVDGFEGAPGPIASEARALGIRSSVGCPIIVRGVTWGVIAASTKREAQFPPNTESGIADFTELVATAILNAESQNQLTASRARLLTEADAARRRVVRDLHDGAQQRLVHSALTLGLAQRELKQDHGAARALVTEALGHVQQANRELRELAHGILPADLTRGGLRGAVDAVVERLDLAVEVDLPAERFAPEIEASAYFIVAEALTNVVKHAHAESAAVSASVADGMLRVEVRDDGIGGADPSGRGLVGLHDRAAALGGQLSVESSPGGGTVLSATLPRSGGPADAL